MSKNQEVSKEDKDSQSIFEPYKDEILDLQRQIKGFKSQISRYKKLIGEKQPESSGNMPIPSQTEPPQVIKTHVAYSFMRDCPECGGKNPGYRAPNVFCDGPECKGAIPLGTIDPDKDIVKTEKGETIPSIRECWNCGKEGDDLHVVVREAKKA